VETKTRPSSADYRAAADVVTERYGGDAGFIIPMLQDLQAEFDHVPRAAMSRMAELLEVPLSQLYSVATFYSSFSLTPRGKHLITLCMGTVCYLKGAREIGEAIQEQLNVEPGGTTDDRLFTFQPVNCLGACALAPVMLINDKYYGNLKPETALEILDGLRSGEEVQPNDAKQPS